MLSLRILLRKLLFAYHLDSYDGISAAFRVPIQLSNFCLAIVTYICAFKIGCVRIRQLRNVLYSLLV